MGRKQLALCRTATVERIFQDGLSAQCGLSLRLRRNPENQSTHLRVSRKTLGGRALTGYSVAARTCGNFESLLPNMRPLSDEN